MVKKWTSAIALLVFLAACGTVTDAVENTYPLEDVVYGDSGAEARVYRAANQGVQDVARWISEQHPPRETSKSDPERMFLVYDDRLVHLMRDAQNPEDTLVEVAHREFVRQNYDPSLLQAFLIYKIVDDVFDLDDAFERKKYGSYIGGDGRYAKRPLDGTGGSVRFGSVHGPNPRGGGLGAGK